MKESISRGDQPPVPKVTLRHGEENYWINNLLIRETINLLRKSGRPALREDTQRKNESVTHVEMVDTCIARM